MKERPIIFSAPMVRAIYDERKTQTRRVIKPQPAAGVRWSVFVDSGLEDGHGHGLRCPYGFPGDRLWVRETFACRIDIDGRVEPERARHYTRYRADLHDNGFDPRDEMNWHGYGRRWRPSIFMPRWASRITLEIMGVKVERMQEISQDDAIAEGFGSELPIIIGDRLTTFEAEFRLDPCAKFGAAWDDLNAKRGYPWESNPWVWALTFQVV